MEELIVFNPQGKVHKNNKIQQTPRNKNREYCWNLLLTHHLTVAVCIFHTASLSDGSFCYLLLPSLSLTSVDSFKSPRTHQNLNLISLNTLKKHIEKTPWPAQNTLESPHEILWSSYGWGPSSSLLLPHSSTHLVVGEIQGIPFNAFALIELLLKATREAQVDWSHQNVVSWWSCLNICWSWLKWSSIPLDVGNGLLNVFSYLASFVKANFWYECGSFGDTMETVLLTICCCMSRLLKLENEGVEELLQPFVGEIDAKPVLHHEMQVVDVWISQWLCFSRLLGLLIAMRTRERSKKFILRLQTVRRNSFWSTRNLRRPHFLRGSKGVTVRPRKVHSEGVWDSNRKCQAHRQRASHPVPSETLRCVL